MNSKIKNNSEGYRSRLSRKVEEVKRNTASYLGKQSDKLSIKQKKLTFIVFGVLMAGVCLSLIVKPFNGVSTTLDALTSHAMTTIPVQQDDSVFSRKDFQTLLRFKHSMDSLKQANPEGYNEFLKDRQGLIDSVNFLIEIYQ